MLTRHEVRDLTKVTILTALSLTTIVLAAIMLTPKVAG